MNGWLQKFFAQQGYLYIDDYSAMIDQNGKLRRELSDDGIDPNDASYRVMADVLSRTFHE